MALNFGVLDQGGPSNFFEGYSQGQEKMQANAMAQQKAAQAQQEFGMRQQEFASGQADKQRAANTAMVTQRTAAARDAILNARTPDEARAIEKAQHADPYLGPIRRQFGSLEADLADIPNEPTAFQQWKQKQAMGADAFLKQQYRQSQVAGLFGDGVAPAPAPANAMAPAANATPQTAPVTNAMAPAAPNVADLVRRRNQALALGETAVATAINSDIERLSKSSETPEVVTMKALGYPLTQAGFQAYRDAQRQERMLNPAEEAQRIRIANASRPPAQPRPEQPLEKVIDPVTGKIVFASREEALKGRMTPASSENKPMTALQQQALKKDFANDTSKVKSAIATADELEKLTDELVGNPDKKIAPHPGLSGITGYSALLPSLPSGEAAKAEQKLETFKGKIKALGRAIASQEGKLGNMAVQEWQMVSDAVQAINPRAGNLDVQMKDVVRQARDLARNMKDKFDLTYEDTAPAAAPGRPAPAAAGGVVDFGSLR